MKGKKCEYFIKKRLFNLLTIDEKIDVLNSFKQYNFNVSDKIKLIKSLPNQIKLTELEMIFKYYELYDITKEEIKIIFTNLNYSDKMLILDVLNDEQFQKELLEELTHEEYFQMFKNRPLCSCSELREFIVNKLSPKECIAWFNKLPTNSCALEKISLLKHLPESVIKIFLEKNAKTTRFDYSPELVKVYAAAITLLSDPEEKISFLHTTNKYNLCLSHDEELSILETLPDSIKLQALENRGYGNLFLYGNDYEEILRSLSDETLISFLDKPEYLDEYFYGEILQFIYILPPSACSKILQIRDKYPWLNQPDYLLELVNRLSDIEKQNLLLGSNKYHLNLTNDELVSIIKTLTDQEKLNYIIQNKHNFNEEQLLEIILSLSSSAIVLNLLTGNLPITKINNLESIIKAVSKNHISKLIKCYNYKIQDFVKRQQKTIINNMPLSDGITLLKQLNNYSLRLTDQERVELIIKLGLRGYEGIDYNILETFDDPEYFINYFLDNMSKFQALDEKVQKQIIAVYVKNKKLSVDENTMYYILKYNKDAKILFEKFREFNDFFKTLNIDMDDFVQYGINNHQINYLKILLSIMNNHEINTFCLLKDYLFNNYYTQGSSRELINNFLEVIRLYNQYPLFSEYLINNPTKLTNEEQEQLTFLLKHNIIIIENIKNFDDIKNYRHNILTSCHDLVTEQSEITKLINTLCQLLFLKDSQEIIELLNITGKTADLEMLKFNNRYNKSFVSLCDELIIVTSLMERITSLTDVDILKEYLLYFTKPQNYDQTKIITNYCLKYEENIRKLYEYDLQISLTRIDQLPKELTSTSKARELKRKYGGEVYDLSNTNYILMAHIKSNRENIADLIKGHSDGNQNYISLSAISHRNQQYYYMVKNDGVILAYDQFPDNAFICSADRNLGTNCSLSCHTTEIPLIKRQQKGILETSQCTGCYSQNSEILLHRNNLRPCGIIIPEGQTPNSEQKKYHKKYHLPFILTQEMEKTITNPSQLPVNNIQLPILTSDSELSALEKMKEDLAKIMPKNLRRIAVLADPHALYEPTLACLVDINNRGITEIYSLGDNIGRGPSPKEVLDLLDKYNVQSVYGNHELYFLEGNLNNFLDHFHSEETVTRAIEMLKWMKQELTIRQIEKIKRYPERYELNVESTKPLTLIHTTKPYTEHGKYANIPQILSNSYIVQGHNHFAKKTNDQDITLRGVGIGQNAVNDGMATYTIIEIQDGKYHFETRYVKYNRSNLLHTINESTMPNSAKKLIKKWVGREV